MVFLFNLISFSRLARHCVHSGAILGGRSVGWENQRTKHLEEGIESWALGRGGEKGRGGGECIRIQRIIRGNQRLIPSKPGWYPRKPAQYPRKPARPQYSRKAASY